MTAVNTPGFGGYVRAVLISLATFDAGIAAITLTATEQLTELELGGFVFVLVATVVVGTPIGAVGAVAVHLLCQQEPRQWVHVWAAGGAGVVVPALALLLVSPEALTDAPYVVLATLPIALAAMIGRAAVIPLVTARRGQLASAAPVRVP